MGYVTKVQKHFRLEYAATDSDALLERVNRAQAIYGIERILLAPSLDEVTVEFDASRLRVADIEATLRRCGLPVVPILAETTAGNVPAGTGAA